MFFFLFWKNLKGLYRAFKLFQCELFGQVGIDSETYQPRMATDIKMFLTALNAKQSSWSWELMCRKISSWTYIANSLDFVVQCVPFSCDRHIIVGVGNIKSIMNLCSFFFFDYFLSLRQHWCHSGIESSGCSLRRSIKGVSTCIRLWNEEACTVCAWVRVHHVCCIYSLWEKINCFSCPFCCTLFVYPNLV